MADTQTKPKSKSRSKPKSIADILQSWEDLRAAAVDKADRLGAAAPQIQALEEMIQRAREMRARHEALKADKLQLTKDFKALREEGEEVARRFQSAVKANLGTKTPLLKQFNMKPIGPRSKSKPAEGQPPEGETPAPAEGSSDAKAAAGSETGGDRQ